MLLLYIASVALGTPWTFARASPESQILLQTGVDTPAAVQPKHIAIIGAGIGGAVTAFDIHELRRNNDDPPVIVTIFEREPNVGGRIHSSYLYPSEGSSFTIEAGAAQFFADDRCLTAAIRAVGLAPKEQMRPPRFGSMENAMAFRLHQIKTLLNFRNWSLPPSPFRSTPDNSRTDLKCNAEPPTWKDYLRLRWKFGKSWSTFRSAVRSTLESWDRFGTGYPFDRITEAFLRCGINKPTYNPADSYMRKLTISPTMQNEYVQPCLRGRFSQNLADVSGLSALLAAGKSSMTSVDGGNSRLVERLIRLSEGDLQLNSIVTAIKPGLSKRYQLSVTRPSSDASAQDFEFDMVILAAPLESCGIDLSLLNVASLPTPRFDTHVTHFSSVRWISSNLTTLPLDVDMETERTLTTSTLSKDPNILSIQRTNACFTRGCLPGSDCDTCDEDDKIYRIHSRQPLEDSDLVRMLDLEFKGCNHMLEDYGIGFIHRKAWPRSYPSPQHIDAALNIVDEVEIARDLFYLNGAESVMSSLEMSCRIGSNVARKAAWRWSPWL